MRGTHGGAMDVLSLLRGRLVLPMMQATDKPAALVELVDFLVAKGELDPAQRDEVLTAVQARESIHTTGLGRGLALPHAIIGGIEREVAVLGLSRPGVDFHAYDAEPARVLLLLVTPTSKVYRHSENVRKIVVELTKDRCRESLVACRSVAEVLAVLEHDGACRDGAEEEP